MFKIFYLPNCPYSSNALQLLNNLNISSPDHQINCSNRNNFIDNPDSKIIPKTYNTYPKILFTNNKHKIFIGGFNELNKLINIITDYKPNTEFTIPEQRFINKKQTLYILLDIIDKI